MHLQFAELPVFDQDRAKSFYTEKLGCRVVFDEPMGDDGWRWIEVGFADARTTLHFVPRPDDKPSPEPVLALVDDDVEGTIAALKAKNVEIVAEPHRPPWDPNRVGAAFRDSEGNEIAVTSG
ncbi:VOC family protein [Phytoactinopolyspora halotolerans]|uniref:Glyoxalase n=1 Tax=Phytoactinopolyspora halotolerans TaxID=1981512 RepID=A0A6L9S0R8_9ACTN|nr:VOC family protein [Phytoactinopolyspora halotolerans]NED98596.1 glyoxalase [Phytoactinopolyspora halotolerans]